MFASFDMQDVFIPEPTQPSALAEPIAMFVVEVEFSFDLPIAYVVGYFNQYEDAKGVHVRCTVSRTTDGFRPPNKKP